MFRFLTKQRATPLQHASAHALDGAFLLPMPLMQLSPQDVWRLQCAFTGTLIMGGTGKTSGSGQALAMAFLQAGFGGWCCAPNPASGPYGSTTPGRRAGNANERSWQGAVSELLSNAFEALYAA